MKLNLIVMLTLSSIPGFSKALPSEVHRLTIRMMDYVGLSADTRAELEMNTMRILRNAGIFVDFVACYRGGVDTGGEACNGLPGPRVVVLRIFQPKFAPKGKQLGYVAMTEEGGACVTVFINPAQQKARVDSVSNGTLLGHAVAHEIGHILLGANSHSSGGIMRPQWRVVDEEWMLKGALLFSADQANRMQMAIVRRGP